MEYVSVYSITCCASGKMYIGITCKTIAQRWKQHIKDSRRINVMNSVFYRAMRFYGEDNFEIKEIFCAFDAMSAQRIERELILEWQTIAPFGLNTSTGGENFAGRVMSDEVKAKISAKKKGVKMPREAVEKSAASRRGLKASDEHRAKHREAFNNPKVRAAMLAPLDQWRNSKEGRACASERFKKLWADPEFRKKQKIQLQIINERKKAKAAERLANQKPRRTKHEAMLDRWKDLEYRQRMIAVLQHAACLPEVAEHCRKLAQSQKEKPLSEKHRKAISVGLTGKKRGPYKKKNQISFLPDQLAGNR